MEELVKALSSADETDRIYAAQDIAETENPALAEHLIFRLPEEESQAVRDAIVFALSSLSCAEIYHLVFDLFHSPDAYLRNAAIGIFESEQDAALPFLSSHLNHADGEVRKLILDALFATGASDAVQAIRKGLDDPAVNVRITAVEYLGRMGDTDCVPRLTELLETEDEPMLRVAVLESFCQLGNPDDILKVLAILVPDDDFGRADPICLPQIIRLAVKTRDPEMITRLIDTITNMEVYAEDILHAIEAAGHEFLELHREHRLTKRIRRMMRQTEDEDICRLCEGLISDEGRRMKDESAPAE